MEASIEPDVSTAFVIYTVFLQIVSPLLSVGLFLSPIPRVIVLFKEKQVGDLPPFPYILVFTQCVLWTMYGYAMDDYSISGCNGFGLICGVFYVFVYFYFTERKPFVGALFVTASIFSAAVVTFTLVYMPPNVGPLRLSQIGCFVAICMFASPLSTMFLVFSKKNSQSIDRNLSAVSVLCCISWGLYGSTVVHNLSIWLPNLIGGLLSVFQLVLIFVFPPSKEIEPISDAPKETNDTVMVQLDTLQPDVVIAIDEENSELKTALKPDTVANYSSTTTDQNSLSSNHTNLTPSPNSSPVQSTFTTTTSSSSSSSSSSSLSPSLPSHPMAAPGGPMSMSDRDSVSCDIKEELTTKSQHKNSSSVDMTEQTPIMGSA